MTTQEEKTIAMLFRVANLLVLAYQHGKDNGGHVLWEDLDFVHEAAKEALAVAKVVFNKDGGNSGPEKGG